MGTLKFEIDRFNNKAAMLFNCLLTQEDYDKYWDESESSMTDNVELLHNTYLKYTDNGDFQIWHEGEESIADNIDITKVPALINELSKTYNFDVEIEDPYQEKYIILSNINSDDDEYHMTLRNNFEDKDLCDCYGSYGRQNTCYDSGCDSINNTDSYFITEKIYPELSKDVEFGEDTFGFDYNFDWWNKLSFEEEKQIAEEYNVLINNSIEFEENVIPLLIKKAREIAKEKETHTQCVAWTYHDGSNFDSLILKCDIDDYCDVVEVDELESALILCEYVGGVHFNGAETIVHCDNYDFRITRWCHDPWTCHITKK